MTHLEEQLEQVYYRCPTLESLDGALQNELQKSSASLIPVETATEFVFAVDSTITVSVAHQGGLGALGIVPADHRQSLTVDQALCRGFEGQDGLVPQRAIAKSIIDAIQAVDRFKYTERQAAGREGNDGIKFKYVCVDSVQNRRGNSRQKKEAAEPDVEAKSSKVVPPTYDCGGAVHIKFSIKRDALNVVYKHNPIHRHATSHTTNGSGSPPLPASQDAGNTADIPDGLPKPKRKRRTKAQMMAARGLGESITDMANSPEANKSPAGKRQKTQPPPTSPGGTRIWTGVQPKKSKPSESPSMSRSSNNASIPEAVPPPAVNPPKGPCVRCRERKIKCNEVQPTCDQCQRGLWSCEYPVHNPKRTRSKNGCMNCRGRKRKCTEERPACAYCVKIDEVCDYS